MAPAVTTYKVSAREGLSHKIYTGLSATEALAKCKWYVLRGRWCEVTEAESGEKVPPHELIRRADQESADTN